MVTSRPYNHYITHAIFAFVLLLLGGCQQTVDKPIPTIRVGHAPHDHHSPLYIAAMNPEHFKQHGGLYLKEVEFRKRYQLMQDEQLIAHVEISSSTGGATIIRRLVEQQFDITYGGVPAILKSMDQGEKIHMLSPVMSEGAGLIVNNGLPATNWDEFVATLKKSKQPLRIGYKSAVSVQGLIFESALDAEGISYSNNVSNTAVKVHLLNLSGAKNLIPSLENGVIDGFVVMQPFLAIAEHKGSGKLVSHLREMPPGGKWKKHPCCAIAASDTFVEEHQEETRKLLTLLNHAREFLQQQPEKSAQQVAAWLENDVEVEQRSLPTINFDVALDETWNRGIRFWISEMITHGSLNKELREAQINNTLEQRLYNHEVIGASSGITE